MIEVTLLVENTVRRRGLLGEHGLAWWIDTGSHRALFDTGQGMAVLPNARALGLPLEQTDAIVLSHGHYDHVGGLEAALQAAPEAAVWFHPRALEPKFSGSGEGARAHRADSAFFLAGSFGQPGRRVIADADPAEFLPGLFLTGEVPRETSFEDTGGPFFLDETKTRPDPLRDDQAVYFPTREGTVVVLGCAHAGVVNTLLHIRRLTGQAPILAVFGGMHLERASPARMEATVAALRSLGVRRLGPCHCTGFAACARLSAEFPEAFIPVAVGTTWRFS